MLLHKLHSIHIQKSSDNLGLNLTWMLLHHQLTMVCEGQPSPFLLQHISSPRGMVLLALTAQQYLEAKIT